jgi:hypothetical protein
MCCSVRPGFAVDLVEEADELLIPMAAHALTCQFPRGSLQFTATPCRARRLLTDNQPGFHNRQRRGADAQLAHGYATHKHPKIRAWLERHPRFHFPLHPDIGFMAQCCRRVLRQIDQSPAQARRVLKGIVDLQTAINRYLVETNDNPKPFIWTADPDAIIEKVRRGKKGVGIDWLSVSPEVGVPEARASVTHLHCGAPHGRSSPTSGALAEG